MVLKLFFLMLSLHVARRDLQVHEHAFVGCMGAPEVSSCMSKREWWVSKHRESSHKATSQYQYRRNLIKIILSLVVNCAPLKRLPELL